MNLAERILKRKHDAMYRRPAEPPESTLVRPVSPPAPPRLVPPPQAAGQQLGDDVVLTRDGRIRRAPRTSNRTAPMSDINVDLDL